MIPVRVVSISGILLGLCVGCKPQAAPLPPPPPPKVTVVRPIIRAVQDYRDYTGRTEATKIVEIRARVTGFLHVAADFREGAEVEAGKLLFEIDPRTFEANVRTAIATLAASEAILRRDEASLRRIQGLFDRNSASQDDLDTVRAAYELAQATVSKNRAELRNAILQLEFSKMWAPIRGRVGRLHVDEGNLVGPGQSIGQQSSGGASTLLTTITALDEMYVYFEGTERGLLEYDEKVRVLGLPTAIEKKIPFFFGLLTDEGYPRSGIIDFRETRIDESTGTITLRGIVPNKDRKLLPGMFCRVRVPIGPPAERLLIPETALSADQKGRYALTVNAENVVEYRAVTVGRQVEEGLIVIESGLKPTDRVIVNGLQKSRPGGKVNPEEGKLK